jgi:hypothetical protein
MAGRARRWAPEAVLGLLAFVLTHQLVFLWTYGAASGVALAQTGHGTGWDTTVTLTFVLAGTLSGVALLQLRRLAGLAGATGIEARFTRDHHVPELVFLGLRSWPRLALPAAALFLLSENVEHLLIGAPLPGLGVLLGTPEYQGTLPILLAVSAALAGLRALYCWRRSVLRDRLGRAGAGPRRSRTHVARRPPLAERLPARLTQGCNLGSRAPPWRAAD